MSFLKSYIQSFKDILNFFKFRKDIKNEFYLRDSKFNRYNLKTNWIGDVVYVQIDCSEEDLMKANYDSEEMIFKKIQPIVEYLSQELNWGDYLNLQIANFVDEDNNPSLSYGVLFVFYPIYGSRIKVLFDVLFSMCIVSAGLVYSVLKCLV